MKKKSREFSRNENLAGLCTLTSWKHWLMKVFNKMTNAEFALFTLSSFSFVLLWPVVWEYGDWGFHLTVLYFYPTSPTPSSLYTVTLILTGPSLCALYDLIHSCFWGLALLWELTKWSISPPNFFAFHIPIYIWKEREFPRNFPFLGW